MQCIPESGELRGWTVFRNGRVGVTTERQQRNERAPPFGLDALKQASSSQVRVIPAGAIGFHRA